MLQVFYIWSVSSLAHTLFFNSIWFTSSLLVGNLVSAWTQKHERFEKVGVGILFLSLMAYFLNVILIILFFFSRFLGLFVF